MARYEKDQRYLCPEPQCGCVIEVVQEAPVECMGAFAPRCCCGRDMVPVHEKI